MLKSYCCLCYFLHIESVSERNGVKRFVDQVTNRLECEFRYRRQILECTNLHSKTDMMELMSKI